MYSDQRPKPSAALNENGMTIFSWVMNITWVVLFYVNAYVFISKYFFRQKYLKLFVSELVVFVYVMLQAAILYQVLVSHRPFNWGKHIIFNSFAFLLIISASTAYEMTREKLRTDKLAKEKENENLKTELSLLRSQVSPHFMFNVLNNMVALARKKSDLLEPSLIKLSGLMRYMLYETKDEKVSLEKEIEYLNSYIDLQMQRYGKNLRIETSFHEIDGPYQLEPMLLIPFVENAFKHGTGLLESALIEVELSAKAGQLLFRVWNRYDPSSTEIKDPSSGIGLSNVLRRLNLLYKDKHDLLITKENNCFIVLLKIDLN